MSINDDTFVKYGLTDDDGNIVRWLWDKPNIPETEYIIEVVNVPKRTSSINWDNFEPALF